MSTLELEHKGSLITIKDTNTCLGYLLDTKEHGIFDASYGKVDVTPEECLTHNKLLDAAMIDGLDKCLVGQGNLFYGGSGRVFTFIGTTIADKGEVSVAGKKVTFFRKGMTFEGRMKKDQDCIFFKRVR